MHASLAGEGISADDRKSRKRTPLEKKDKNKKKKNLLSLAYDRGMIKSMRSSLLSADKSNKYIYFSDLDTIPVSLPGCSILSSV